MQTKTAKTSVRELIESSLSDSKTSWSVGCFGAIAEFHWTSDEQVRSIDPMGRETARGSVTVEPSLMETTAQGLAWESAGGHGVGWTQGFAFHLPAEEARMGAQSTLARVGDDEEGALYDIGIGAENVDACVVSHDPELSATLDQCLGRSIWEDDNPALAAIKEASPTRLFRSKAARVRVRQHIGSRTGRPTPEGPHTHVIRNLLRTVRSHDARIPLPEGRSIVLSMYPPHPSRDELGQRKPFDRNEWESFQALLERYGSADFVAAKREVFAQSRGNETPPVPALPGLARVLLPQLAHLDVSSERLDELAEAWKLSHILEGVRSDRGDDE